MPSYYEALPIYKAWRQRQAASTRTGIRSRGARHGRRTAAFCVGATCGRPCGLVPPTGLCGPIRQIAPTKRLLAVWGGKGRPQVPLST